MKLTNISQQRIYLKDLKITRAAQTEGRRGEDRYLKPGDEVYIPNTSEVLRSAIMGDLRSYSDRAIIRLEDIVDLEANGDEGDSLTLDHNLGFPPAVYALKKISSTWVDATGSVDVSNNLIFTQTFVTNTLDVPMTFLFRLL